MLDGIIKRIVGGTITREELLAELVKINFNLTQHKHNTIEKVIDLLLENFKNQQTKVIEVLKEKV